ncbi:MAG: hypothetical protein K6B44_13305 [Lachnospiraceae bacterium]|nr:hypothetical protein [Lachnospiraceae bacterium]
MKKKKIIIIAAASLLVIVAAVVTVVMLTLVRDPKTKVIRAFARLFSEDVGSRFYAGKDSGRGLLFSRYYQSNKSYRKSAEKALQGRFGYDGSLKLEGIQADMDELDQILAYVSGIKLNYEGELDLENERIHLESGLSYAIISLPRLVLDISGSEVALSADGFFDGALTVDTEGMGSAYNNSELARILGVKLDSTQTAALDTGLFPEDASTTEQKEEVIKAVLELYDAVEVDKPTDKRHIFIDGSDVACDVYPIKVKADDINNFFSKIGVTGINVQEDCTMEAALTPKGNLAYFEFEYEDCVFDMEIRSEECARNDMNLMFANPSRGSFELICTGSENNDVREDRVTLNLYINGHELSCDLVAESTMSPELVSIDLDEIKLSGDFQEIDLSGSLDLILEDQEMPEVPEPKREILKMSEADYDSLGVEIYDNLMKNELFAAILNQFGGEPLISDLVDLMNSGR